MPVLVFLNGPLSEQRVPVDADLLVGREDAGVTVDDPEVSRQHAVLRLSNGELQIEDLGSRNGTFVNDQRISGPTVLGDSDVVRIGTTRFSVELDSTAGETVFATLPDATVFVPRPDPKPPAAGDEAVEPAMATQRAAEPQPPPAAEPESPQATPPAPPPAAAPVHHVLTPQLAEATPPRQAPPHVASRQAPAAVITFLIIIATGIALAVYFVMR